MIAGKPLVLRVYLSLSGWLEFAQAATDQDPNLAIKSHSPKFVDGTLYYHKPSIATKDRRKG